VNTYFVLGMTALLAFSGCLSGTTDGASQTSDPTTQPTTKAPTPTAAAGRGGIQGQVLDDEQRPVGNMSITIEDSNETTITDASGNFSFSDLPPGQYGLLFNKTGYEPASKSIHVKADESTTVSMVVLALASNEGWTQIWEKKVTWARVAGARVLGTPYLGGSAIERWQSEDKFGDMQGLYFEATFQSGGPMQPGVNINIMPLNEFDNPNSWLCTFRGTQSPITCDGSANITKFIEQGWCKANQSKCWHEFRAQTLPAAAAADIGAAVTLDMTMTFYASHFYRQPMPQGYQARPPA
jgi:hypothetical protein